MISYDNYKNRIQKLAKAKKLAHKFRFLIMGVLAVVLGGAVGLMLAKGAYTSEMTLSAQTVLFNQPYEVTPAKAFLASPSSQKIEYSSDGGQWDTEKPVKAGKYYARTVSPKIVGYSYSKPVEFEILPIDAQFDIVGESVVYGDVPKYSVPQLISGHRVVDEELAFEYANYGAASTEVTADRSTFKIVDGSGDDFTGCYNVTFNPKTLTVLNRAITVEPDSYSFTYDGSEQTAENAVAESTLNMLARGDRAEVKTGVYKDGTRVSAVNAGDYVVQIDEITIWHGETDVTARYDKTVLTSALKILQRELSVTTGDATKVYDGEKLESAEYDKANLVESHEIILPAALPYALNVSDSAKGNNAYEITVKDKSGADVTANYDIKYTYGTLTVERRELTFATDSATKTYDGVALTQDRYEQKNLVEGHEIGLAGNSLPSRINSGETENSYEIFITDQSGNPVTENYDIKYTYGTLTVNKREITVSTGDLTAVFNGEMQTNTEYKSVGGAGLINDPAHGVIHTLVTDVPFAVKDVTPAGGVDNTTTYSVTDGSVDVTDNYTVTYAGHYGKIIINPRIIYVETASASRPYNGNALTAYEEKDKDYFTYYINADGDKEEGLKGGDTLAVDGTPASITNVGTQPNAVTYTVGGNYEIDEDNYVYGTLEITARRISVKTASKSRQYNGEPLTKTDEYETSFLDWTEGEDKSGLLNGDMLTVDGAPASVTERGSVPNAVKYTANANYDIVESAYEWGTLEVTARQIYVITASAEKEYDGEPLSKTDGYKTGWIDDDGNKTQEAGLLGGDALTVYSTFAINEVGGPDENTTRYYATANYTIITDKNEYGTLTITPRPIIVTTASVTKTFDGQIIKAPDYAAVNYAVEQPKGSGVWVADTTKTGLITRGGVTDELTPTEEFEYDGAVTGADGVENKCAYKHVNSYGQSNYDIHYAYGKFIVTGRAIKIITPDASKGYDGTPLTCAVNGYETYLVDGAGNYILDDNGEKQTGLVNGDKLTAMSPVPSITDVGTLSNTVTYTAPDNYVISGYEYGTLKVTVRGIYVYINSASKVYDGTTLSETGYRTYDGSHQTGDLTQIEQDGLIGEDKLNIDEDTVRSIVNVGTLTNTFDFDLPLNENGECNYYLLGTYAGTLEITVRTIYVVTGDGEWTYDGGAHGQPDYKEAYYLNADKEKEEALILGHELKAIESTVNTITNYMGEKGIENMTEFKVVMAIDGAESDNGFTVNDNYHIEYPERGRLVIDKAALAVLALNYIEDNALTYGEKFTYPTGAGNFRYSPNAPSHVKLVNGEELEIFVVVLKADEQWNKITSYGDPIQPDEDGSYSLAAGNYVLGSLYLRNTFKIWKDGVEVTYVNEKGETVGGINNYTVISVEGRLTVNKKAVTVAIADKTCEYGGLDRNGEFPENEYTVTAGLDENGLLPYGETFTFEYLYKGADGVECTPKNKGDYTIFVNEETVIVNGADGEVENGAANYDITFVDGTLKITPRKLELTIKGPDDFYYGTPIGNLYVQKLEEGEEDPMCYGENLSILVDYFDEEGNKVTRPNGPKDAGTYTIKAREDGYILEDAEGNPISEGLANYDIDVKGGTLWVKKLPVKVIVDDQTCEYGGLDGNGTMPKNGFSVEAVDKRNPHPYGETFELSYFYADDNGAVAPKNAGTYEDIIRATATVSGTGVSADKNYDIIWEYGTLEITKKQLTLIIEDQTVVYGDEIPEVEWYFATDDTFINGYWEKDENFRLPYGEKIIAGGFYYYYYVGEEFFSLHKGDVFNVRTYRLQENWHSYAEDRILDVSDNYRISTGWNKNDSRGKLTVTPRPIELEISEIAPVTYGDTFAYASTVGNYLGSPDLKHGDGLQIAVKYLQNGDKAEARNAGKYTADIDLSQCIVYRDGAEFKFINDDGEEVGGINNYLVTCKTRDCEILRRRLFITLKDLTVTYGDYDFEKENPYHIYYNTDEKGLDNYDLANSTELAYGEHISVKVGYVEDVTPLGDFITPKNFGSYKIILVNSSDCVTFYDSDGNVLENGGDNYYGSRVEFSGYGTKASALNITKRDINVSIHDLPDITYGDYDFEKVNPYYERYAGLNNYDLANSDALPYGEQLKISVIYHLDGEEAVTPKNVGEYVIALDGFEVYNKDGNSLDGDGKSNYNVIPVAGTLTIGQKLVAVFVDETNESIYGVKFNENTYKMYVNNGDGVAEQITGLPYGEELSLTYKYRFTENGLGETVSVENAIPRAAGKYTVIVDEKTVNGNEEGLANYDFRFFNGHLLIRRAKLSVKLFDLGQIVYGKPFTYSPSDYVATGLRYDETLEVAVFYAGQKYAEAKNVDTYVIELDKANTLACDAGENGEKRNVELNYEVTCEGDDRGAVEIVKRAVKVSFTDASCTYGEELPEIEFTLQVDIKDFMEGDFFGTTLPYGETLSFKHYFLNSLGQSVEPKNEGTYFTRVSEANVTDTDGKTTGADNNYDISYARYGGLFINKKDVHIKLDDMPVTYGDFFVKGIPATHTYTLAEGEGEALANGEKLTVNIKFTAKGDEATENYIQPKNAGGYSIVAADFTVQSVINGATVTETAKGDGLINYNIVCDFAELTIAKRAITVTVDDTNYDYGDEPVYNEVTITSDGKEYTLPYNETLNYTLTYFDIGGEEDINHYNAGEYTVKIDRATATINMTAPVTDNYEPEYADGKLTVNQKAITVSADSFDRPYGTKISEVKVPFTVTDKNGATLTELPFGDELNLTFKYRIEGGEWTTEPQNVGTYEMDIAAKSVSKGNARVENYAITPDFGTLEITKFKVNASIAAIEPVTYGEDYTVTCTYPETLPYYEVISFVFEFIDTETGATVQEPKAAGTYKITISSETVTGGNASADNYDIEYDKNEHKLVINKKALKLTLNAEGTLKYEYGPAFDDGETGVRSYEADGLLEGQYVEVAVIYRALENAPAQSARSARRAKTFAARLFAEDGAEKFTPRNVGKYIAELDWNSCILYNADGTVAEGGMDNYKWAEGFTCAPVEFEIVPMSVTVTVTNDSADYGVNVSEVEIDYNINETLPYGEELALTFDIKDGEEKAKNAGTYDIAIANKIVNGGSADNYSVTYSAENPGPKFEITPKELNLALTDMTVKFGNEVKYATGLNKYEIAKSTSTEYGEQIEITAVKYLDKDGDEATEFNVNDYGYDIVLVSFAVHDKDGVLLPDGRDNYSVATEDCRGKLIITSLGIIITTGSDEKEYDGTPLYSEKYSVEGELAEGYSIVVDKLAGPTDVTGAIGVDNLTTFKVQYYGVDSDNYAIEYNPNCGKLKVMPRPIRISTESASKYYDGTPLQTGFKIEYIGETEGAPAVPDCDTPDGTTPSVTEYTEKTVTNEVTFTIKNSDGKDVSGNYSIDKKFGSLRIDKVEIEVILNNIRNHVYGEEIGELYTLTVHRSETEVSDELPNGETLVLDVIALKPGVQYSAEGLLSVGSYTTGFNVNAARIEGGNANIKNYALTQVAGRISVVARSLTVTVNSGTWTYDGKAHSDGGYEKVEYVTEDGAKQGILEGDGELTVKAGFTLPAITAAGSTPNHVEYDVPSDNYVIVKTIDGTLTVNKRTITVETKDINAVYDGKAHSDATISITAGLLAEDQKTVAGTADSWTDVTEGTVQNVVPFEIHDKDGNDVTSNYEITTVYGTVRITKRPVEITTDDYLTDNEYNGSAQGTDGYSLKPADENSGVLTDLNHALIITKSFRRTDATANEPNGYVDNAIEFGVFLNGENGEDLTRNYDIQVTPGKVVIERRAVNITLNTVRVEYGGAYASALNDAAEIYNLVGSGADLSLVFTYDREVGDAGDYVATLDWSSSAGINCDINNYKCEVIPSVAFTVYAKSITVTLNDTETVFEYGADYVTAISAATVSGTIDGETLEVALKYQDKDGNDLESAPVDKGEYIAVLDWANGRIIKGGSEKTDGLANYAQPVCSPVPFTIRERTVKINTLNVTVEYGDEIAYPTRKENKENYADIANLLSGETLEITSVKYVRGGAEVTPLFAGEYGIVVAGVKVTAADGRDVTANYAYDTAEPYGVLKINGVSLVITRISQTKPYDGAALSLADAEYTIEKTVKYTIGGQEIALPDGYSIVLDAADGVYSTDGANVQTVANTAKYKVIGADGKEAGEYVVSYNETEPATLSITQREVKYSTNSASKPYDGAALEFMGTNGYGLDLSQLVSGHTLTGTQLNKPVNVSDSCTNEYSFTVKDGETDVTENYKFTAETNGTLTIDKLNVTVKVNNVNAIYGEEIDDNGFTILCEDGATALPNGETLTCNVRFTYADGGALGASAYSHGFLNAGTYKIVADEDTVAVDKNGKDNYNFEFVSGGDSGNLVVAPRTIIVITDTVTKVYDGLELHVGAYAAHFLAADGTVIENTGLLGGDKLTVDDSEIASKYIVNVDALENAFSYAVPNGNYVIDGAHSENGTLTITERNIEIVTGSTGANEWTYDGTAHSKPEAEAVYFLDEDGNRVLSETGLVLDHELVVSKEFSVINATEGTPNAVEYIVSNETVNGNYIIKYTYGTLIVNKAKLTVTLSQNGKNSFVYGEDFETEIKDIKVEGFFGTEEFTVVEVTYNVEQPKNAGSYTAHLNAEACESTVTEGAEGITNGLDNYQIECEPFSFTITRKAITLELDAWESEDYDGNAHVYTGTATGAGFEYGEAIDTVAVSVYADENKSGAPLTSVVNSGTYYVFLNDSATTLSGSDEYLATNYDVTCENITFTVLGVKFTVQMSANDIQYTGEEYDFTATNNFNKTFKVLGLDGEEFSEEQLKKLGLTYTVGYSETPLNVGSYTVTLNKNDMHYDDVNYTYAGADEVSCSFEITKRTVEITVHSLTVEDDGKGNLVYTKDDLTATPDSMTDFLGGFVGSDLEKAFGENGGLSFDYKDLSTDGKAGVTAYKEVSLVINPNSDVLKNYDIVDVEVGYLTVTNRMVLVKVVYNYAEKIYNGEAVKQTDFRFEHSHNVEGKEDEVGFVDDTGITATYKFFGENGIELENAPVNAGKYTVKAELSGGVIDDNNHLIEIEPYELEIKKRPVKLTLSFDEGSETEFVYGATAPNASPEFSVSAEEAAGSMGFVGMTVNDISYALTQNGAAVTRYNAGDYRVGVWFADIDNYELDFNDLTVKINPRKIVIGPKAPAAGVKQQYGGTGLTIGDKDYEVYSKALPYGDIVEGDELTVTANKIAPTSRGGYVKIAGYAVTAGGEDITKSYDVVYEYKSQDDMISALKVSPGVFQLRMDYQPIEIHYNLAEGAGESYPYNGSRIVHNFDKATVIDPATEISLPFGHELIISASSYTTSSEKAGRYENWLKNLLTVVDGNPNSEYFGLTLNGNIYSFICDNAEEEAVVITSNVLSVTIDDTDVESIPVGKLTSGYSVPDGVLLEGHKAEVYVLDRNGEKFFGVTVVNATGRDVGDNYTLAEGCIAEKVTVIEAEALSRPSLAVKITVSSPEGNLTLTPDGLWKLNVGCFTVDDLNLKDGEKVAVYAYVTADGEYYLGVTVSDKDGRDVSGNYNLYEVETVAGGVSAKFITVAESTTLMRNVYLDFTRAEDGTVQVDAVGVPAGEKYVVEATYDEAADEYTVVIYEIVKRGTREIKMDMTVYYYAVSDYNVKLADVNTLN